MPDAAAPAGASRHDGGARPRLGGGGRRPRKRPGARRAGPVEVAGDRSALCALHLRHDRRIPKGVVRDMRAAIWWRCAGRWRTSTAVKPGETFWTASDIGWVVGHSYIVYGPLIYGCSTVLYEGKPVGTPDAGAFWRVIAEYKVSAFFHRADRACAPCARRTPRRSHAPGATIISRRCARCSSRASGRTPDTVAWAAARDWRKPRSSTIGGRPRPAGPSRPTRSAWG